MSNVLETELSTLSVTVYVNSARSNPSVGMPVIVRAVALNVNPVGSVGRQRISIYAAAPRCFRQRVIDSLADIPKSIVNRAKGEWAQPHARINSERA